MTATENAEGYGARRWRFLPTAGGEGSRREGGKARRGELTGIHRIFRMGWPLAFGKRLACQLLAVSSMRAFAVLSAN